MGPCLRGACGGSVGGDGTLGTADRFALGHGRMKKVPLRSDIVQSARDMGIGFGD